MVPRAVCRIVSTFRVSRAIVIAFSLLALIQLHASAQTPANESAPSPPEQIGDVYGEEVLLTAKTVVFMSGKATWDNAFPTLIGHFKSIAGFLGSRKLQAAGAPMTIYTSVNDSGFQYQAGVPVAAAPANLPRGMTAGQSPAGKAYKFVHRGSYDSMDMLYETIVNFLDEKKVERQGLFVEEYVTDPTTTAEDKLVINVFVLVK